MPNLMFARFIWFHIMIGEGFNHRVLQPYVTMFYPMQLIIHQRFVAGVILISNWAKHPKYPRTVYGTLNMAGQSTNIIIGNNVKKIRHCRIFLLPGYINFFMLYHDGGCKMKRVLIFPLFIIFTQSAFARDCGITADGCPAGYYCNAGVKKECPAGLCSEY